MKTLKISLRQTLVYVFALFIFSCTKDFEKWNTNPHQVTEEQMSADFISTGTFFVQMEKNVIPIEQLVGNAGIGAEHYQIIQNLNGDAFSGYLATPNPFSRSNNTNYGLLAGWYGLAFNHGFTNIMQPWKQIQAVSAENNPEIAALATILKVIAFQRITDMYGPIPYTDSGTGIKKVYDAQKNVYDALFNDINKSISTLSDFASRNPGVNILSSFDFTYNGNVTNWIKLANTIKLRMAIRISYADAALARQMAEEACSHPIGLIQGTEEAAGLKHALLNFRHPLIVIGDGAFKDTMMGAVIESIMNGYRDPRLPIYFKPASDGRFRGVRNGIIINSKDDYAEGPFSYANIGANVDLLWVNPAESFFLRAEGALRNWNVGGNAKDLYEQGVSTSFAYWGAGNVQTYLANGNSVPAPYTDPKNIANNVQAGNPYLSTITIKWNDTDPFERKLERIITQKWLAIFPDGQEAWSEFRRTGYPKNFPVVMNNSNGTISTATQIRRLPFPTSEYLNNADNVGKAVALLGGLDNGGTKLWWDKK